MKTNHVLIDYENVHVMSLELLQGDHFRVVVFLGPRNTKLPVELVLAMQRFGTRAEYGATDGPNARATVATPTVDDLIRIAVDDLVRRKASKPRKTATLRTTIHARCGKELPAATIEAVYAGLVKKGYVKVSGTGVSYSLPNA